MPRAPFILAAVVLAFPASAQQPNWSHARRVEVTLSNFDFTPRTLHLRAGEPVILHLVNSANGGHNFSARDFFAASAVRPQDRTALRNGIVELRGHAVQDIAVVPRAGRYRLRCTHRFHTTFGMRGEIVVG